MDLRHSSWTCDPYRRASARADAPSGSHHALVPRSPRQRRPPAAAASSCTLRLSPGRPPKQHRNDRAAWRRQSYVHGEPECWPKRGGWRRSGPAVNDSRYPGLLAMAHRTQELRSGGSLPRSGPAGRRGFPIDPVIPGSNLARRCPHHEEGWMNFGAGADLPGQTPDMRVLAQSAEGDTAHGRRNSRLLRCIKISDA